MKKFLHLLLFPIRKYLEHRKWKQRLKELKRRDPFIYK